MYRLKTLKNGMYQIHSKHPSKAFEGTLNLILVASETLGVKKDALSTALVQLDQHNHDYAEFSKSGYFILTGRNGFESGPNF